ncbi:MAG: threonine ammonia-lyase [Candidatus Promineifilaceae bacterium]
MVTISDVLQARRAIRPFIRKTPLIYSPYLSEKTGGKIWLKLECWQPTGSFKVRGALNKIYSLTDAEKARGVVTASAGNHGLGVSYAASQLGVKEATIFVPNHAPQAKVTKLQTFSVTLRRAGETYEEAHQAATRFARETGAVEIPAYDDTAVIAGQGTMALEIMAELPQADVVVVPVGGGGMMAGIATVLRALAPKARLVGVQPDATPAALLSYQKGAAIDPYNHAPTLADGLAGGFGALPFALTKDDPPEIVLVNEDGLLHGIYAVLAHHQLVVEPSGAVGLAALLAGAVNVAGKTAVCVLSGGNVDVTVLRQALALGS